MSPEEKLGRRRFNEALKLSANYVNGGALAVLVFGGVRYIFDAGAPTVGYLRLGLAFVVSLALHAVAVLVVRQLKPEE